MRMSQRDGTRAAATERLVASADADSPSAKDWAESKSALERSVASKLP